MTDVRAALAQSLSALDGYSGEDMPQSYLKEADEVIERLYQLGFEITVRPMHDKHYRQEYEAIRAEVNGS